MWNHQSCQKSPSVERRSSLTKRTANHKFHTESLFPTQLDFIILVSSCIMEAIVLFFFYQSLGMSQPEAMVHLNLHLRLQVIQTI